jgi:hypothetical protein
VIIVVIQEARRLANQEVLMQWHDRRGDRNSEVVFVFQLQFIPFYGPCLITSAGEIPIDKIEQVSPLAPKSAAA